MDEKKGFLKFIKGEECSRYEFYLANKYFLKASDNLKRKFYAQVNQIVRTCMEQMIEANDASLKTFESIYAYYGISDGYMERAIHLYTLDNKQDTLVKDYILMLYKGKKEKLMDLFFQAKEGKWDLDMLKQMAGAENMSVLDLQHLLAICAKEVLNIPFEDFEDYKKSYVEFTSFLEGNFASDKLLAKKYADKYANAKEKQTFKEYVIKICNNIQRKLVAKDEADSYLKKLTLNDYELFVLSQGIFELESFGNMVIQRLEKYYQVCALADEDKILKCTIDNQMTKKQVLFLAQVYAQKVLHRNLFIDQEETRCRRHLYTKEIYAVLDTIKDETDNAKIQEVLRANKVEVVDISVYCYGINYLLPAEEIKALERKLLTNLRIVQKENYKMAREKKKRETIDYGERLQGYMHSELSFDEFCRQNAFNSGHLKTKIDEIKEEELVRGVKEKMQKERTLLKEEQEYYAKQLALKIKNSPTKFTLFDYFDQYNGVPVHTFKLFTLNITQLDKKLLNMLFKPLRIATYVNKEAVIASTYEFNCAKDKNGFPIKGTGRVLTEEELADIVNYCEENNIPLYDVVINEAAKAYANNTLDISSLQR